MRRSRALGLVLVVAAGPSAAGQQTWTLSDQDDWQSQRTTDPSTPAGKLAAAREALAEDQPGRARSLSGAWIKAHPNHPLMAEAHLIHGDALLALGDEYEALFDYEAIARVYPGSEAFVTALQREFQVATMYARGLKRKFLGMRVIDTSDEAQELLIRVQERMPGSELAEQAGMELGDMYFRQRKMELAADMYAIFLENYPRSHRGSRALRRLIYAHLATFKGPEFDASGLSEARLRLHELIDLEPATAQQVMADSLLTGIDESEARKLLITARWYDRTGDSIAAEFTVRRLLERFPRTVAARDAIKFVERVLPKLPASILAEAPDYALLRQALPGVPAPTPRPPVPSELLQPPDPGEGDAP